MKFKQIKIPSAKSIVSQSEKPHEVMKTTEWEESSGQEEEGSLAFETCLEGEGERSNTERSGDREEMRGTSMVKDIRKYKTFYYLP